VAKPEDVARAIVNGIEHGHYLIFIGFAPRMSFWLSGLGRGVLHQIEDFVMARAQKKMRAAKP
jgi:hypothetical protein